MSDGDRYRVIVIDDDPDVAELTRTVLERRAASDVRVLADPGPFLEALADFDPDVVVTDIEMPGMTGLAMLDLIREQRPGLPVIMMTAHPSTDYAIRALRAAADEFLTKPVPSSELVAAVVRLAQGWRAGRAADDELRRAAEVQRGLLPQQPIAVPGYLLAGGCAPARVVGGDFFDWYTTPEGASFTLADVMGKGIGPAILAATVRATLRSQLGREDLDQGFAAAAERLEGDLDGAGSFVTVFHCVLSPGGAVRYLDAGHGLSLLVRADGSAQRLATTSLPLGLALPPGIHTGWRPHTMSLRPGDTLVSTSDGVLDLFDGTLASLDRVAELTRAAATPQQVVDGLLELATPGTPDDVTVVALRRDADGTP